jgi:hypothetical protein
MLSWLALHILTALALIGNPASGFVLCWASLSWLVKISFAGSPPLCLAENFF